ncbi:hypothetical protein [Rhodanobacter sp. DHG33]|uniref:hypothetical protein n=1 Tax=Rhodanobacter sp. DHG33 TaxID=2775921 RepID=UPI0017838C68|nr:hypothetical protein [Rhodanobacter sp. DHG33]MBD8899146.1 hypothetical protein [Rhodanobacter sp. DHG33]
MAETLHEVHAMTDTAITKPKLTPYERAERLRARADAMEKRAAKSERAKRTRRLIIAGSYFESAGCLDAWEALTETQRKAIAAYLPAVIAKAAVTPPHP